MNRRQQSIDLLNETHQFPTPVMIKVIGEHHADFVSAVLAAVREEMEIEEDLPFSTREARGGRHIAVTLEPRMNDAEQVLAVYARLRMIEGVVLLM